MKKTISFLAIWAFEFALFYLWLAKGYQGAFNVIAVIFTVSGVILLLANFLPEEKFREHAKVKSKFRATLSAVFTLAAIVMLLWVDRIWLGAFYLFSWGLFMLRVKAAAEATGEASRA
jgi:hypothetical protein